MSIKNEVDIIRKENLKLNKKDTKLVFETLMKVYKSKIVNEARNIMGYTLDVVVAKMDLIDLVIPKIFIKNGEITFI